jgi:hypothetical protein
MKYHGKSSYRGHFLLDFKGKYIQSDGDEIKLIT